MNKDYKIYQVGGDRPEFIIAETVEQAIEEHLSRYDRWENEYDSKDSVPVEEISFDRKGMFEQESGGYKEMTFAEFLGKDFVYDKPQVICWVE